MVKLVQAIDSRGSGEETSSRISCCGRWPARVGTRRSIVALRCRFSIGRSHRTANASKPPIPARRSYVVAMVAPSMNSIPSEQCACRKLNRGTGSIQCRTKTPGHRTRIQGIERSRSNLSCQSASVHGLFRLQKRAAQSIRLASPLYCV